MKKQNHHIIRNINLEIDFENLEEAIGLQDKVAEVFYDKLQPELEKLFDEIAGEKNLVKLEKLEIDCGTLSDKNWEKEWIDSTLRKLRSDLLAAHYKSEVKTSEGATESLLFFLEHGYFLWNNRIDSISQLEQLVLLNEEQIIMLKKLLQRSSNASERLAFQFSENFRGKIIRAFAANKTETRQTIFFLLKNLNIDQHIVDAALLKAFANDNTANVVHQFFTDIYSKVEVNSKPVIKEMLDLYPELKTENPEPETKSEKPSEGIYINNAGLIILHPFFTELFEQFNLSGENRWIDPLAQHQAAVIMQFLVTGKEDLLEFDLPLNKILCGMEVADVIAPGKEISDGMITECENLLRTAIKHWSVLKNTGIEAFRETFLQRNGKLSRVDKGWLLQVEQKSVDILLSHLPWGIGIIKTPWMQEMLYVEWT